MSLSVLSIAYPIAPVHPDAAGGSEQILSLLDRTLVRSGHRSVVIACQGSSVEGRLIEMPLPPGPLNPVDHARSQELYRQTISRILSRETFDLIHMHSLDFHAYLPPPGPPVLVTLHLPADWYPPHIFHLSRPDTWLQCVSESQARACPPSRALLKPIPNGVPSGLERKDVHKRDFAVAVGRICPEKGFHLALHAAAKAGAPLILAGQIFRYPAHYEYFQDEIAPMLDGRMRRFIGHVTMRRKRRLLTAARCLLVTSQVPETSSLVAMEALACGTPVIALPTGALPEIIDHGRTGFLVDSPCEIAEAISRVDTLDPEDCRRAARTRFSAQRMVSEYLALYNRLSGSSFASANTPSASTCVNM